MAVGHVDNSRLGAIVLSSLHVWPEEPGHEHHWERVGVDLLDDVFVFSLVVLLVLWVFLLDVVDQDRDSVLSSDLILDLLAQAFVVLPFVVTPKVKLEG